MIFEWLNDNFSIISSWCSIAGFIVTLWVLYSVKKIKNFYSARARIPQIVNQLKKYSNELNILLEDISNNEREIISVFKKLQFTLSSINKKGNSNINGSIRMIYSRINKFKYPRNSFFHRIFRRDWNFNDEVWYLYTDLQGIIQGLKELEKDSKWNSP